MSTAADSIASQLATMDYTELLKLRTLTDFWLQDKPTVQFSSETEQILFEAIKAELSTAGVNNAIMFSTISTGKYLKAWKQSAASVNSFLDNSFSQAKSRSQRLGLCRIFIQALIGELKYKKIPVSAGTIVRNLHHVHQVFDRAFPSYLESGLAYLVVKSMIRSKKSA